MNSRAENFYQVWRENHRAIHSLRETAAVPPEKVLQTIWQHQRLLRSELKTTNGKSLRILHPGFISVEGGPDFRGAVLQFENEKPVSGDVEIDLQPSGWRAHGHDQNPHFKNVRLHVVWETSFKAFAIQHLSFPTLALKDFLDAPLAELALALENETGLPEPMHGKCSAPLRELSGSALTDLLHAAAKVRLQNKANAMLARAKHSGWEQALWENLFRALGYKHNVWPMLNLAETKMRWQNCRQNSFELQSRLLGLSGLLPVELTRSQKTNDSFLRRAWDLWWRERDEFSDCSLPRTAWKFHGLRPANHPQRRLALAAHWLAAGTLVSAIEKWIATENFVSRPAQLLESLHQILQVERDDFWSWHWTFNSVRLVKPQPLLGETRVSDLAVNVILPWLWLRAREGSNKKIQQEVERRFFIWPAADDNSVLKLARQRLLGSNESRLLKTAAQQQGLMQIVHDFCEHSNAICADCRFPELVQTWNQSAKV